VSRLGELLSLRDLTLDDAKERLGVAEDKIEDGLRYEGMSDLTLAHDADAHPGYFYFRDGRLVMLYVENLDGLDADSLRSELGEPEATLRSRAGKGYAHRVYPGRGIAYSSKGDDVAFVEVFPPTSLDRYEREIYEDPGEFIK
jgi:hypothetical protein